VIIAIRTEPKEAAYCWTKKKFSKAAAIRFANMLTNQSGQKNKPYLCMICHRYHVGRKRTVQNLVLTPAA
jgi:hypothetical protein